MPTILLVLLLSLAATAAQADCVKSDAGSDWVYCDSGSPAQAPVPKKTIDPKDTNKCLNNSCTETPAQLLKNLGFKEKPQVTLAYKHIPANLQALACSYPEQKADCKIYFAGATDTVAMMYAMDSKSMAICGNTTDLIHEFIQEVRANPKARDMETHMLLFYLLDRNHSCTKTKGEIKKGLSAGYLIDMCKAGDLGFNLCSQYQAGFINTLLFLSEQTKTPILCGDQWLMNSVNLSNMLNDRLQANLKLRHAPAVTVMLNELMTNMPCSNK